MPSVFVFSNTTQCTKDDKLQRFQGSMKQCRPMCQTQVEEEENLDIVDEVATESIDVM